MAYHDPRNLNSIPFRRPVYDMAHPVLRAWRLAWSAQTERRQRDAWWLCWHLAESHGMRESGPGAVRFANRYLLPPGSPFRYVDAPFWPDELAQREQEICGDAA